MPVEVIGHTVTGDPVLSYPKELYGKHWQHPLCALFAARGFDLRTGMNWLQDRAHIADECAWPHEVDPHDVLRIVKRAKADWLLSSVEKLFRCQDISISRDKIYSRDENAR